MLEKLLGLVKSGECGSLGELAKRLDVSEALALQMLEEAGTDGLPEKAGELLRSSPLARAGPHARAGLRRLPACEGLLAGGEREAGMDAGPGE